LLFGVRAAAQGRNFEGEKKSTTDARYRLKQAVRNRRHAVNLKVASNSPATGCVSAKPLPKVHYFS
jgi:hypothetical protein